MGQGTLPPIPMGFKQKEPETTTPPLPDGYAVKKKAEQQSSGKSSSLGSKAVTAFAEEEPLNSTGPLPSLSVGSEEVSGNTVPKFFNHDDSFKSFMGEKLPTPEQIKEPGSIYKPESIADLNVKFNDRTGRMDEFDLSMPEKPTNILDQPRYEKKLKAYEEKKFLKNHEAETKINKAVSKIENADGSFDDIVTLNKEAPKLFEGLKSNMGIDVNKDDVPDGPNKDENYLFQVYSSYRDKAADKKLDFARQKREEIVPDIEANLPATSTFTGEQYKVPTNLEEAKKIVDDINKGKARTQLILENSSGGIDDAITKVGEAKKAIASGEKIMPALTQMISGFVFDEVAKENPNASPYEVGKKIFEITNPQQYDIYKAAGGDQMYRPGSFGSGYSDTPKKADAINRQMTELGVNAFQLFGNKNSIQVADDANKALGWNYTLPVEEETKHMIAAQLRANGISPNKATQEEKDAVAETLPTTNKNVWFQKNKTENNVNLPSTGFWDATGKSYHNTIEDATKTLLGWMMPGRGRERALDVLESQGTSSTLGENPESVARLDQLREKEKEGKISESELKEKNELEKYTDIRTDWQKFKDLSGSGVGQFAGFGTISAFTGGLNNVRSLAGATKALISPMADKGGMLAAGYLMSREGNARDAVSMFPGEEEGVKRFVYGEVASAIDTYTERIFPEEKFLSGVLKQDIARLIPNLTEKNLRKELNEGLAKKIAKTVVKGIAEQQKTPLQEGAEEGIAALVKDVFAGTLDPDYRQQPITFDQVLNTATQAYLSSQLLGVPKGVMAQRNAAVPLNAIWDAASSKGVYGDVKFTIEEMKQRGELTEPEANERISLLNTAQKNYEDNPILSGNMGNLSLPKRQNYLGRLMNEQVLQKKSDEATDENVKRTLNKEIAASKKARAAIYDGDVAVNNENKEIPQSDDAWKERIAAATTEEEKDQIMREHGDWLMEQGKKDTQFLKDQSLDTPNGLKAQLGSDEAVVDVIAQNIPAEIKKSLDGWVAKMKSAKEGSLEFEEAESHVNLLEQGLEKAKEAEQLGIDQNRELDNGNEPGIEQQKADIEKRREEELSKHPEFLIPLIEKPTKKQRIDIEIINKENIDKKEQHKVINAKYDAELAALKLSQPLPDSKVATPALGSVEGVDLGRDVERNKELVNKFPQSLELNDKGELVERLAKESEGEYSFMGKGILGYHEQYYEAIKNDTIPKELDAEKLSYLKQKYKEGKINSLVDVFIYSNKEGRKIAEKYESLLPNKQTQGEAAKAPDSKVLEGAVPEKEKKNLDVVIGQEKSISEIGTPEEYYQYLKTVFPNSTVNGKIFFHRGGEKVSQFDKSKLKPEEDAFYFKDNTKSEGYGKEITPAILNITKASKNYPHENKESGKDQDADASIIRLYETDADVDATLKEQGRTADDITEYGVYTPEQIHVLGSKADIEGFKKWKESAQSKEPSITVEGKEGEVAAEDSAPITPAEQTEWDGLSMQEKLALAKENLPEVDNVSNVELIKMADDNTKSLLEKLHSQAPENVTKNPNINGNEKSSRQENGEESSIEKGSSQSSEEESGERPDVEEETGAEDDSSAPLTDSETAESFDEKVKEEDGSGISHAETADIRDEFGLGEYEKKTKTDEELEVEANDLIKKGFNVGEILSKIENDGYKPSDVENLALKKYIPLLEKEVRENPSDKNIAFVSRFAKALDIAGTLEGRAFRQRQGLQIPDDSLIGYFLREMEETGTDTLTRGQKVTAEKEWNDIREARDKFEKWMAEQQAALAERDAALKVEEMKKKAGKKTKNDLAAERKEIITSIGDKWKKAGNDGTLQSGIPFAKQIAAITPDVLKLARNLAHDAAITLKDLVNKIDEILKADGIDIGVDNINAIVAGRFNEKKQTKTELSERWRDLRDEAELIEKLAELERGEEPANENKKIKRNRNITELREKIADIQKRNRTEDREANKFYGESEAGNKRIEDLEDELERLRNREEKPKVQKTEKEISDREKELKEQISAERKKIREEKVNELDKAKNRLKGQIEKVRKQLDSGDFSTPVKKEVAWDEEGRKLQKDLVELQKKREIRLLKQKYEQRSNKEKAMDKVAEIANIPRSLMASMDFSAPLNQAFVATIGYPKIAAAATKKMFQSAFSQQSFDNWFHDLKESPDYDLMKDVKLKISDPHSPFLTAREESFMSGYAEQIPGIGQLVKGSERAYVQFLNKMRVDIFRKMVNQYENNKRGAKTYANSKKLYEKTARYVNNITGAGDLGKLEQFAPLFNGLFFSPRLMASRIRLISPIYFASLPKELKVAYLKDIGASFGLASALLGAFYIYGKSQSEDDPDKITVETDMRSSDFGKIKQKNTRWNPWGGFQPYFRLIAQLVSGKRKSSNTGIIQELSGEEAFGTTRGDVATSFVRGKLAPVPGMAWDFIAGKNMVGEKVTLKDELLSHITPLSASAVIDSWKDYGVKSILNVGVPSAFGIGTQTYKPRQKEIKNTITFSDKTGGKAHDVKVKLTSDQHSEFEDIARKKIDEDVKKLKAIPEYKKLTLEEQVALQGIIENAAVRKAEKEIVKKYKSTFKEDEKAEQKRKDKEVRDKIKKQVEK